MAIDSLTTLAQIGGNFSSGNDKEIQYNNNGVLGSSSNFVFDHATGLVGIGLSAPSYLLHVTTATAGSFTADADADELVIENNTNTGISIISPDASAANIHIGSISDPKATRITKEATTGDFTIGTAAGAERLRITAAGNVGIGKSPSYKLDVDGNINISAGNTLKIDGTDAVFSNWSTNAATIYRNSNVGIGDFSGAAPTYNLDVVGNINFTGNLYQAGVLFSGGSSYWTQTVNDIYYSTGNVGVKNSSPTYDLDVVGDINFTGGLYQNGSLYSSGGGTGQDPLDTAIQAAVFMIGV